MGTRLIRWGWLLAIALPVALAVIVWPHSASALNPSPTPSVTPTPTATPTPAACTRDMLWLTLAPTLTPTPTPSYTPTPGHTATPTATPTPPGCMADMQWWLFPNALLRVPVSQEEKYAGAIVWPPQPWKFGPVTLPDSFKQLSGEYKVEAQMEVKEEVQLHPAHRLAAWRKLRERRRCEPSRLSQSRPDGELHTEPFCLDKQPGGVVWRLGRAKDMAARRLPAPPIQAFVAVLPQRAKNKINESRLELLAQWSAGGMLNVDAGVNGPEFSGGAAFGGKVLASVEVDLRPVAYVRAEGKASGSITLCAPQYSLTPQFGGLTGTLEAQLFAWKATVVDLMLIPPVGGAPPCTPPPMSAAVTPAPPAPAVNLQPTPIADALTTSGPALALDSQGNGLLAWIGLAGSGPALDATEVFAAPVSGGQAGTPVQVTPTRMVTSTPRSFPFRTAPTC